MKFDIRYANHPDQVLGADTKKLRDTFLIEKIFSEDEVNLTYSHNDRIIVGGVMPVKKEIELLPHEYMAADYFLQRRELGIINIGGDGEIVVDGEVIKMVTRDGLYLGRGVKTIVFRTKDSKHPAKFYLNSTPAHKTYPNVHIPFEKTNPRVVGSPKELNSRTIYQYLHKSVLTTCSIQMGLTVINECNAWNTMPCHTHERRMEVYLYFDFPKDQRVIHIMGRPTETRHLIMAPDQAVISPSWSVHTGVGTTNYTFIWGMCGENQEYDDMQHVQVADMK